MTKREMAQTMLDSNSPVVTRMMTRMEVLGFIAHSKVPLVLYCKTGQTVLATACDFYFAIQEYCYAEIDADGNIIGEWCKFTTTKPAKEE